MSSSSSSSVGLFRPGAGNGVWCSCLLSLALWCSFSANSSSKNNNIMQVKYATFITSVGLTFLSLTAAYRLVYAPKSRKNGGGILKHFYHSLISDLFEREESIELRLKREKERNEALADSSSNDNMDEASSEQKPDYYDSLFFMVYVILVCTSSSSLILILGSLAFWAYKFCLPLLFQRFPASFTFGEGCLMLQGCLLYLFESVGSLAMDCDLSLIHI